VLPSRSGSLTLAPCATKVSMSGLMGSVLTERCDSTCNTFCPFLSRISASAPLSHNSWIILSKSVGYEVPESHPHRASHHLRLLDKPESPLGDQRWTSSCGSRGMTFSFSLSESKRKMKRWGGALVTSNFRGT
jgi:hypothetical protein